ncbi:phage antirepressor [Nocardia sp. NPDC058519]|uniref:phage antirepressor n=1 Tax=Nocardia sp. NPDC058519 TaxID=3346535 RepID=UPI00365F0146
MSTDLMPFTYEGATVRTVVIDGEPWFVLADLCAVLEIRNGRDVAARLADDQKGVAQIDTLGGRQQMTIVNEPGMYEVVIRSDKAGAVMFRRWITGEVLPAIRKTGGYSSTPALTDDELIHQALTVSARRVAELTEKVAELAPKAAMADDFLTASGGARLVREVAKLLGMKEKDLRRFLLDEGLVFAKHAPCGAVQYDHYAQFGHHFQATEHVVNHTWGSCTHYTLMILPRGIELIEKRRSAVTA